MARSILLGAFGTFLVLSLLCLVLGIVTGVVPHALGAFWAGLLVGLGQPSR